MTTLNHVKDVVTIACMSYKCLTHGIQCCFICPYLYPCEMFKDKYKWIYSAECFECDF